MVKRLTALLILIAGLNASGATWDFNTPPSSLRHVDVNADWTPYTVLELPVELTGTPPQQELFCSLFFQTKQNLWFESRNKLILSGEPQRFRLRLDDLSPDWQCANAKRPFGPDVLRWVRCWGIKVFSKGEHSGRLKIGNLRLIEGRVPISLCDVTVPRNAQSGMLDSLKFRINGFTGNPYRGSEITALVECKSRSAQSTVPAYFRQDFVKVRHPGTGKVTTEPLELPYWQADWQPASAGEYRLTLILTLAGRNLKFKLGDVDVSPKTAADGNTDSTTNTAPASFLAESDTGRLFQYRQGKWSDPIETGPGKYRKVQLDWTGDWGMYMGAGDFDQFTAWQFEQQLQHTTVTGALPIVVFNEAELKKNDPFNWLSNPMNKANGGTLQRPGDYFEDQYARQVVLDRARYMWARYSRQRTTSGLLILLKRRNDSCRTWITGLAAQLAAEFPGITILCNNPDAADRWKSKPLALYEYWKKDDLLSKGGSIHLDRIRKEAVVTGQYPGSTAIVTDGVQHLAGGAELTCDIYRPAGNGSPLKVMCTLRTDRNTLFQSPLVILYEDEVNRASFPLNKPELWECPQNPGRTFDSQDLLNVREIGLRFFCDGPGSNPVHVRNSTLHWPYKIDLDKIGKLTISNLKGNVGKVPCFNKFELDFQINRVFNNPYDPKEIDVRIEMADPDGRLLTHPGYYNEPWDLKMVDGTEITVSAGTPSWRVRFTPSMTGKYKWRLLATTEEDTAFEEGTFTCTPSPSKGFIRISRKDPRCFELSDGTFFFPIGHNLRSPSDRRSEEHLPETRENSRRAEREGTKAYEKWFKQMRENGANFTRIWMCPWWCGLEASSMHPGFHGVEYYNQGNAARLDRVLELAEARQIYVNIETMNHGMLSTVVDGDWKHSPWNKYTEPNGYLAYATEYITNERSIRWHRNGIRYAVARWGYSTAIAWWGVITETEWTEPYHRSIAGTGQREPWIPYPYQTWKYRNVMVDWLDDMAGHFRKTDGHPHLVSVHFSNPGNGLEAWSKRNLEVVHNNAYTDFTKCWLPERFRNSNGIADVLFVFSDVYEPYSRNKPLLVGEWGGTPNVNRPTHLSTEFHVGLWSMLMTRMSGLTGFWWWHLIDTYDLYSTYRGPVAFMEGEDRRGKNYFSRRADLSFPESLKNGAGFANPAQQPATRPFRGPGNARRWGSSTWTPISPYTRSGIVLFDEKELFAYIYCLAINQSDYDTAAKHFNDERFPESGPGTLALPIGLTNGKYRLEYWNTYAGSILETREVIVSDAARNIPLISHRVDLAIKLKKMD
jgi:hypothetical protein